MVEHHLILQRLASADFVPMLIPTDPYLPAQEALAEVREAYPQRRFDLVCDSDLPSEATMDGDLVAMALTNLLNNAAKYSPPDTPVQIAITIDSHLAYRISDNGPGIAADEKPSLFTMFHRSTHSEPATGFRIGLATVNRVAAVHQGPVTYADGDPGGAVFTLALPLTDTSPEEAACPP